MLLVARLGTRRR